MRWFPNLADRNLFELATEFRPETAAERPNPIERYDHRLNPATGMGGFDILIPLELEERE